MEMQKPWQSAFQNFKEKIIGWLNFLAAFLLGILRVSLNNSKAVCITMLNMGSFIKRGKDEKGLRLRKAEELACPDIPTKCISFYGKLLAPYTMHYMERRRI